MSKPEHGGPGARADLQAEDTQGRPVEESTSPAVSTADEVEEDVSREEDATETGGLEDEGSPETGCVDEEAVPDEVVMLGPYALLGITCDATAADVRKAYREQALRWHPDKAGSGGRAKRRFQAIADAYELLSDESARACYDAEMAQQAEAQRRPTFAELQPGGLSQPPFRATMGEIRSVATFRHLGKVWAPQIHNIEWARLPREPRRIRLTFSSLYAVRIGPLDREGRSALHDAFKGHLEHSLPPIVTASFYVESTEGSAASAARLVRIRVGLEGESSELMDALAHAHTVARSTGSQGCPMA